MVAFSFLFIFIKLLYQFSEGIPNKQELNIISMKNKGCMVVSIRAGALLILFIILGIAEFKWDVNTYNNLVNLEENVEKDCAQLENAYPYRTVLIPNLAHTTREYTGQKKKP